MTHTANDRDAKVSVDVLLPGENIDTISDFAPFAQVLSERHKISLLHAATVLGLLRETRRG